jgi:hypothetical protein
LEEEIRTGQLIHERPLANLHNENFLAALYQGGCFMPHFCLPRSITVVGDAERLDVDRRGQIENFLDSLRYLRCGIVGFDESAIAVDANMKRQLAAATSYIIQQTLWQFQ